MDLNQEMNSRTSGKQKMSKEDLLAGKTSADEPESVHQDPRFKSPDEILLQMMAQKGKNKPTESLTGDDMIIEHVREGKNVSVQSGETLFKQSEALKTDLKNLNDKYERERTRWQEYEQNVIHWKDQVMNIVEKMKIEAADAETLKKEIAVLTEKNRQKDEEIRRLMDDFGKDPKKKK